MRVAALPWQIRRAFSRALSGRLPANLFTFGVQPGLKSLERRKPHGVVSDCELGEARKIIWSCCKYRMAQIAR